MNIDSMIPTLELDDNIIIDDSSTNISDDNTDKEPINDDTKVTPEKSDKPVNNEYDDVATAVFEELVNNGIVQKGDKEKYNWDDINNAVNHYREELPDMVAQSLVSQTPELAQTLIDYIFTKGQNLTEDDLKSFYNEYITDLNNANTEVNLSTVDEARGYLDNKYKEQGYRKSMIDAMLDALEDEEDNAKALFDEAKKVRDKEKSQNNSTNILTAEKEQQSARKAQQQEFTQNVITELKNTGWNSTKINQIRSDLASKRTWDVLGSITNSPKGLVKLANLMNYWDNEKEDFILEDFVKQVQTKEVKSLKDKINEDMIKTGSSSGKTSKRTISGNLWEHLTPVT